MTTNDERPDPAAALVNADGQPIRRRDDRCPHCGADPSYRVVSGGFGRRVHDICGRCGHDFGPRPFRV